MSYAWQIIFMFGCPCSLSNRFQQELRCYHASCIIWLLMEQSASCIAYRLSGINNVQDQAYGIIILGPTDPTNGIAIIITEKQRNSTQMRIHFWPSFLFPFLTACIHFGETAMCQKAIWYGLAVRTWHIIISGDLGGVSWTVQDLFFCFAPKTKN